MKIVKNDHIRALWDLLPSKYIEKLHFSDTDTCIYIVSIKQVKWLLWIFYYFMFTQNGDKKDHQCTRPH